MLSLTVSLTLKTANQSFRKTIWLIMMHHHTKVGINIFSNSEYVTWTNIHWHFEILLWPWPWYYTTIPSLVEKKRRVERFSKYWADTIGHTEKISSGQAFTDILNVRCDFDLEHSNPIFPSDNPAYDAVLSNKVWLQTDQQFRRYNRNSYILIICVLAVTLTLKVVYHFFPLDTSPHDNIPPYQVWQKMAEWLRFIIL